MSRVAQPSKFTLGIQVAFSVPCHLVSREGNTTRCALSETAGGGYDDEVGHVSTGRSAGFLPHRTPRTRFV